MVDAIDNTATGGTVYTDVGAGGFQPATHTVQDVMTTVRRMFGDEAAVQVADTDIIAWINDGQDVIVNRNRILKTRAFTVSIPNISQYQFPNDAIEQIESIHYKGIPLKGISFAQAEQEIRYWGPNSSIPTDPVLWWEWAGTFTFWPAPSSAAEIALYYTTRPTRVATSTDLLSLPDKYFQTLCQYCIQQAYELDDDWQSAQAKQQQFEQQLTQFSEEERSSEHMTYDVITDVDDINGYYGGPDWI